MGTDAQIALIPGHMTGEPGPMPLDLNAIAHAAREANKGIAQTARPAVTVSDLERARR